MEGRDIRIIGGSGAYVVKGLLAAALLLLGPTACGTATTDDQPDGTVATTGNDAGTPDSGEPDGGAVSNPGHTLDLGGVMHHPGNDDPLHNCVACHGAALRGGGQAPSCYNCHNNDDHTSVRGGHKHLPGASSICVTCHGPNNSGGLGPACSTCH